MRLLLHMCCGPCSTYPVNHLRAEGHELTGYFYNPNIHPYKEFRQRLDTCREYAARVGLPLVVDESYTLEEWLGRALAAPQGRCRECYEHRLRQAAEYARDQGFDAFSTTLLVSPYQKHDCIRAVGDAVAAELGIPFYYVDFRPGWPEGVRISKEMELYRQPYCGCVFSERDRYYKPGKRSDQNAGRI